MVELNDRADMVTGARHDHRFDVAWNESAHGEGWAIDSPRSTRRGWTLGDAVAVDRVAGGHGAVTPQPEIHTVGLNPLTRGAVAGAGL